MLRAGLVQGQRRKGLGAGFAFELNGMPRKPRNWTLTDSIKIKPSSRQPRRRGRLSKFDRFDGDEPGVRQYYIITSHDFQADFTLYSVC